MEWLLILVMINSGDPHIINIPMGEYSTEIECRRDLRDLTEEANDTTGSAVLVCLKDIYKEEQLNPIIDDSGPLSVKMKEWRLLNSRYW